MQHGVGGAAERDDHGDRILEGFFGHDVFRTDAFFQQLDDGFAGFFTVFGLVLRNRRLRRAAGQAHAHRFDRAGHGVGGVHAAAGTSAGDGGFLDFDQFFLADFLLCVRADRFKYGNDIGRFIVVAAGHDGAAVNEDRWAVEARQADHATGHVFVAAADGDDGVEAFTGGDGFDRVGDDFARNE